MSDLITIDIADYLIGVLADLTALDEVRLFIRGGAPYTPNIDQTPYIEVEIGEEQEQSEYTGGIYTQTYIGLLTLNVSVGNIAGGDWLEIHGDRIASIPSVDQVARLLHAAMVELQKEAHRDMGGLMSNDGVTLEGVTNFYFTSPRIYGLDDRTENFSNFGSLPFVVETQRTRI